MGIFGTVQGLPNNKSNLLNHCQIRFLMAEEFLTNKISSDDNFVCWWVYLIVQWMASFKLAKVNACKRFCVLFTICSIKYKCSVYKCCFKCNNYSIINQSPIIVSYFISHAFLTLSQQILSNENTTKKNDFPWRLNILNLLC